MDRTFIFIDECGKADYTDASKVFAIVGVVIDQETRIKLTEKFKKLKLQFFKKESFVFHRTELRNDLKVRGKDLQEFATFKRKATVAERKKYLYSQINSYVVFPNY